VAAAYSVTEYRGLKVAWRPELMGGGRAFGQDFIPLVGHLFGRVSRLFEFCAGPGAIGFSLLAHGHCDQLVLSDVNPEAIEVMRETIRLNNLDEKVTVYESDGLKSIPAHESWDLVVANPPHFPELTTVAPKLISDDPGWRLHRDFYRRVGDLLAPGGSLLMQENSEGSTPEDFLPMIAEGGLSLIRSFWYTGRRAVPPIYYMWITKTLPGLTFDDGPTLVTLPLHDFADAPVAVPAGRPCIVRLSNKTGHPVQPRLVDESGAPQLLLPLGEIPAGAEAELPVVALRPGDYEVNDTVKHITVARLVAL
jgi:16S rRNA G966 N2-methylase RsmD